MTTTGRRLALAQMIGNASLDKIYAPVARDASEIVLSHAIPDERGVQRLDLRFAPIILAELRRKLDAIRPELVAVIMGSVAAAEVAAIGDAEPLPRDVATLGLVVTQVGVSLALNQPNVLSQVGALLRKGVAGGLPASLIARRVRQYFSPLFAPRRSETGKLLRVDREELVRSWPGHAGRASAHVRLVLLTETTAAHGRTMIRLAERDHTALRWRLSPRHLEADACTENAKRDSGLGEGVYLFSDVPRIPQHPRCRCYVESVPLIRRTP